MPWSLKYKSKKGRKKGGYPKRTTKLPGTAIFKLQIVYGLYTSKHNIAKLPTNL